jgi:hypothetical protein
MPSVFEINKADLVVLLELRAVIDAMRQGRKVESAINTFRYELHRREYPASYINGALQYARREAAKN